MTRFSMLVLLALSVWGAGDPHGQAPLLWLCSALVSSGRPLSH